jgi:outer membrane protein TolC
MKEIGAMLPQLSLFGQYELYRHDLTVMEPKWAVGIGVTLPLFEGGSRVNKIGSAKSVESRVSYLEAQAGKDIEVLVEKRYQELGKALEQFEMLETSLASAQEHLRIRKRSFEEGYAMSTDVVDARLALSRVQIGRLASAYDFDVALAELLEACGISERFEDFRAHADTEGSF